MRQITLLAAITASAVSLAADPITVNVKAGEQLGEISPFVYGVNHNDFSKRPHIPFTRQGGNRMTAYNWENNASNAGNDWHHQNDAYLGGGEKPGEVARGFAAAALKAGATVVITVPMAGYVAADKKGDGDVNKTPDYLNVRFVKSHPKKPGAFEFPPNLQDRAVYQDEFVWFLNREFPQQAQRLWYSLDNEPDLWSSTHARIRPEKLTYAEMVDLTTQYASAIKDVNPDAQVVGFASYGYAGYMHLQGAPDADGRDFLDFFLASMKSAEQKHGRRLMDVLDLHWYPEARGGGKRITFEGTGDADTIRARVQAPRSLWDESYTEDSWIARDVIKGPVNLLPRLKTEIDQQYPGTRLAILEYDYGGGDHISGAIAQADVLGIFGREGVHAAALWGGGPYLYAAFDAFLNYDGNGGRFGDVALQATSSNVEDLGVHASTFKKDPRKLVLILINRAESARECTLRLDGATAEVADLFRITAEAPKVIPAGDARLDQPLQLPGMSITIAVVR